MHRPGNSGDEARDIEGEFDVYSGPRVLDMTLSEFAKKRDLVFEILHAWIKLGRFNVALMRFGRAATVEFAPWSSEEPPTTTRPPLIFSRPPNQHGLVDKICLLLESLKHSYFGIGGEERAQQLRVLLKALEDDLRSSPGSRLEALLE